MYFIIKLPLCIVVVLFFAACGSARPPDQLPLWRMSARDMFPNDPQAQALALAAARGDTTEMDRLIAAGADPNATGTYGVTVPAWVLYHPNKAGFRHLLQLGADPNKIWKSNDGNDSSLIHWTVRMTRDIGPGYLQDVIQFGGGDAYLKVGSVGKTPVDLSVAPWLSAALGVFIEHGVSIDYKGYKSKIPLVMLTSSALNFEATLFLLHRGANYTTKTLYNDNLSLYIQRVITHDEPFATTPGYYGYMSFWRCVDFLEKHGESFVFTKKTKRPPLLDQSPPDILSGLGSLEP